MLGVHLKHMGKSGTDRKYCNEAPVLPICENEIIASGASNSSATRDRDRQLPSPTNKYK